MQTDNYWNRAARRRADRRTILKGMGVASTGVAALALIGCGDDESDSGSSSTATTAASGTAAATQASQPKVGGTYRWAWQGTPHLDMHQDSISGAQNIIAAAYNRLLRFQDTAQVPEPDLAKTMPEQPDKTTYIFKIQEGVKFHDKAPVNGRVMTAKDVAFSLNRARTDSPSFIHRGDLANVDKIEAVDDTTLRLTTKSPDAVLLSTIAGYQFFVLAEETLNQFDDLKTDKATIGTGGFVVESAATDTGAILVRNPNYWREGKPYFEKIQQIVIGDHWSQFLAKNLETAAVAAEIQVGFKSFEDVLKDAKVDAYTYEGLSYGSAQGHFMNNGAPPFNDLRVRQAINLICNREDNLEYGWPIGSRPSIALGLNQVNSGFGLTEAEVSALPGYRADKRKEDVADGLALLAAAGFSKDKPLEFEIMAWSVPHRTIGIDEIQLAAEMYQRESGGVLKVSVKGLEWGTWKAAEANHEFQMISSAYSMGVDAHDALAKMYGSTGGRNFAQFKDPKFDSMLTAEKAEFDLERRKALIKEMIIYLNDPSRIANVWTGTGPAAAASIATVKNRPPLMDAGKIDQLYFG
ncbi:MAG: ABC transporter substrate-binding protein [Dehalococcoidia bacterium]